MPFRTGSWARTTSLASASSFSEERLSGHRSPSWTWSRWDEPCGFAASSCSRTSASTWRALGEMVRGIDLRGDHPLVIQLEGESPYDFSSDAEGIGDLNGDGYADVAVFGSCLLNKAARAYVVFGEPDPPRFRNLGRPGLNG